MRLARATEAAAAAASGALGAAWLRYERASSRIDQAQEAIHSTLGDIGEVDAFRILPLVERHARAVISLENRVCPVVASEDPGAPGGLSAGGTILGLRPDRQRRTAPALAAKLVWIQVLLVYPGRIGATTYVGRSSETQAR